MQQRYEYIGPLEIMAAVGQDQTGISVSCANDLSDWAAHQDEWDGALLTVTFVILENGTLRVAPRRSEHVSCALGGRVLAAGELTIRVNPKLEVVGATNQSTGYCPEPDCWDSVLASLTNVEIPCPSDFTTRYIFRKCPQCQQRNLVKEAWYVCDVCGHDLPSEWNFMQGTQLNDEHK